MAPERPLPPTDVRHTTSHRVRAKRTTNMEKHELPVDYVPPQIIWRLNDMLETLHEIRDVLDHIVEHLCMEPK